MDESDFEMKQVTLLFDKLRQMFFRRICIGEVPIIENMLKYFHPGLLVIDPDMSV